jgi:hypothetical protein
MIIEDIKNRERSFINTEYGIYRSELNQKGGH